LDLLHSCNKPALWHPLIWCEDHGLKEFLQLESILLPGGVDLFEQEFIHSSVFAQVCELHRAINALGPIDIHLDHMMEVRLMQYDDGEQLLHFLRRMHADIAHEIAGFVYRFETLKGNVLSAL
ncbi:hypothetical protein C0995_010098, partial [Termitomyces sp. Mi166